MDLNIRSSREANVEPTPRGWRLSIRAGEAGRYRIAQLDNCTGIARRDFPYRSLSMSLRARVSSGAVPGTWGFGTWNDPYRSRGGPGETVFHALTLPNAAWFFSSSPESWLSFRDDRPGNGFLAQVFSAPSMPLLPLAAVGGTFLFSRRRARQRLSRLIREEAAALSHDVTEWHTYSMEWREGSVSFEVDGTPVLNTDFSPKPPLAAVIWIDNQYAAFTPQGRVAAGSLKAPAAWLEIEDLQLNEPGGS